MTDYRSLIVRPEWMDDAACRGLDTEVFFPEQDEATRDVKAICRTCDVQAECLAYALNIGERFGIWGGKSEKERRVLRRRLGLAKDVAECGTVDGWNAHRQVGEGACDECQEAYATYRRERRREGAA